MKEEKWKVFERECCLYLNSTYSHHYHCCFVSKGGSNAHNPDINVEKSDVVQFAIEAKCPVAQSGQFVLFPDDRTGSFKYSPRNEFPLNEYSKRIIEAMEKDYERYSVPSSDTMPLDKSLFYDWIKNHYIEGRNTRFVISRNETGYVIFPIEKFDLYFDVQARYRIKNSGSSDPGKNNLDEIKQALSNSGDCFDKLRFDGKEVLVDIANHRKEVFILQGSRYRYQFKKRDSNTYNIRRLSNTRNANVVFSIVLKRNQDPADLRAFIQAIS